MKTLSAKFLTLAAAVVVSCGLFSQQAAAAPIQGDIDFVGTATYNTNSLATATRVNSWSNTRVLSTSGNFSSIPDFNVATFTAPYVFNFVGPQNLWTTTFGGQTFSFQLLTSMVVSQNARFLQVSGTGIVSGTGFDNTAGLWSFSSSKSDGGTAATFSFQANTTAVPEGGSALALLGIALVGVEVLRRKFASA